MDGATTEDVARLDVKDRPEPKNEAERRVYNALVTMEAARISANFEDQMQRVRRIAGTSPSQIVALEEAALTANCS